MLGSPLLYIKGMRILMFQLSGFYYIAHKYAKPAPLRVKPFCGFHAESSDLFRKKKLLFYVTVVKSSLLYNRSPNARKNRGLPGLGLLKPPKCCCPAPCTHWLGCILRHHAADLQLASAPGRAAMWWLETRVRVVAVKVYAIHAVVIRSPE